MMNKEHNNYLAEIKIEKRIDDLAKWLEKHRFLITQSDRVKITLNVKGSSIIGEVTNYPEQ